MKKHNESDFIPYTGDPSLLACCLRARLSKDHGSREIVEEAAFKVATSRHLNRESHMDRVHLAEAWDAVFSTYPIGATVTIKDDRHSTARESLTVEAVSVNAAHRPQYKLRKPDGCVLPWKDWAEVEGNPL